MTRGFRFIAASLIAFGTLTLSTSVAQAQQFGPSPQAMYQQHPGSAPTYVSYGAPTVPGANVQTATPASQPRSATALKARTTATAARHRSAARTSRAAGVGTRTSGVKGTTGR